MTVHRFADEGRRLLDAIDRERITVFGTSAKFISGIEKAGLKPRSRTISRASKVFCRPAHRCLMRALRYVYRDFNQDVLLASIAGGTDIISCFVGGCPTRPVYTGQIQCRALAMAVEFWDEAVQPLTKGKGELVCKNAVSRACRSAFGMTTTAANTIEPILLSSTTSGATVITVSLPPRMVPLSMGGLTLCLTQVVYALAPRRFIARSKSSRALLRAS
jgi:acyl-coenzyme A synthetase/AMP-(fatty) acid ligase